MATETENKTEPATKPNTKKLGFSNTNPVVLECPVCSKPFERENKQKAFNAIRGHYLGTKDGKHEGSFPYTLSDFGLTPTEPPLGEDLTKRAKVVKEPTEPLEPVEVDEEEIYEDPIEQSPNCLDVLSRLLQLQGVRKRQAILDTMNLGDPRDLMRLAETLSNAHINHDSQCWIISDYAERLRIPIPQALREALQPQYEDQPLRPWSRRRDGRASSQMEGFAEMVTAVGDVVQRLTPKQPTHNQGNEVLERRMEKVEAENKELREKLSDEKIESLRQEFNAKLSIQDDGVKLAIDKLEQPIKRVGDLFEKIVVGVFETEFPRKAPIRKKLGKSTLAEQMLELSPEMVE